MSDVPPVTYPVGRSAALAGWLVLPLASGWVLAVWACFQAPASAFTTPSAILLIVISALAAASAWQFWRRQLPRQLHWDGARWQLGEGAPALVGGAQLAERARVQVRADAQRWLLLRFEPDGDGRGVWLWAQASSDPARWHLLRCALYLPQSMAGQPAAAPDAERA